ncbi:MAG: ABC transporter substrate-binding protein [Burkholderiales bacterium]
MKSFRSILGPAACVCAAFALLGAASARADEAMNALYQKAKVEGKVVMYTSVPTFIVDQWRSQFEALYPGVKLEYFRSGTGKVLARIDAEKSAGQLHGDLVWVADATAYPHFAKEGMLESYKTPEWDHIPFGKDPGGYYVTGRILAGVIFANTKEMQEPPASWADLAQAKYKGKVAMASAVVSGSTTVMVSGLVHDAGLGWPYFQKLKDNGILILQDVPDVARAVASGERPLGITLTMYKYQAEYKDSPVKMVFPKEGPILMPSPMGLFAKSEHPNAGRLLYRFLLSKQAQAVLAQHGIYPARDDVAAPEGLPPLAQVKQHAIIPDADWMIANWTDVKSQWRGMFGR